ncbi:MAG: VWA domain-containing protein, partial [Candidatus Omnitrophica bacterium]|nr:VWA domain-containing protein [Candidatus Omnitrophota bacterium]
MPMEEEVAASSKLRDAGGFTSVDRLSGAMESEAQSMSYPATTPEPTGYWNTEDYDRIYENEFLAAIDNPLSTFSIDVDTASYSNVRRYLNNNQLPPVDAVRIEEMVNYFSYNYPQPQGNDPFSITTDAAVAPWNPDHQLIRIGLQGKVMSGKELPPSNLVFLIDVSGSMNDPNKLPLLKSAYKMMVNQLSQNERVAIVVYAGAAGTVLDSTPGSNKQAILEAIDRLSAGGSTAGAQGIQKAYDIAKSNFIKGGNNRVILATDGDFNVGVSSDSELTRLIEEKRKEGIFLTVLGFGTGNYKDNKMEKLANKGNGNYYYIDTEREAKKVLVNELGSTLFTIAKDVKIQIEFNPAQVQSYRLIGYENRILAKEDFNDDTKDAGELGAGHSVTALYEIIPARLGENIAGKVDPLKYQAKNMVNSQELMTVKLRYKQPDA